MSDYDPNDAKAMTGEELQAEYDRIEQNRQAVNRIVRDRQDELDLAMTAKEMEERAK